MSLAGVDQSPLVHPRIEVLLRPVERDERLVCSQLTSRPKVCQLEDIAATLEQGQCGDVNVGQRLNKSLAYSRPNLAICLTNAVTWDSVHVFTIRQFEKPLKKLFIHTR